MTKDDLIRDIVAKLQRLPEDALEDIDGDVDSHIRELEGDN